MQAGPGRRDEAVPVVVPLPAAGPEKDWDEAFWVKVLKVSASAALKSPCPDMHAVHCARRLALAAAA
jgi:hypothetical protein